MRTMGKAVGLLLAVAFLAGLWQSRYGQDERPAAKAPRPFRTTPVEQRHPNRDRAGDRETPEFH